jgi:hypothetical protein
MESANEGLMQEFIGLGKTIVVCVNERFLDKALWAG